MVTQGDRVSVRWQWKGTHRATFHGPGGVYAPTGNQITNDGMAVFQVKDGKVVRSWMITDRFGFCSRQIGALPKAPTAASPGR